MLLDAKDLGYRELNERIKAAEGDCRVVGCCGQRFIAAGLREKTVAIDGIPGNALGAYLDGAKIVTSANAQDAVGDTMNDGSIIVHGNIGDAAGYAMRGGRIFVKGNAGYRAGIHMKEYHDKVPVMIIGGSAGSFLGEYQAGGVIVVLGLGGKPRSGRIVGNFPCTGMHGGKLFLRSCEGAEKVVFPPNLLVRRAEESDLDCVRAELEEYCKVFGYDLGEVLRPGFMVVTPDSHDPYKQMYVAN